jgi:hypothetical protein
MEGVNKATNLGETNDLAMTRYLGLPRDSHLTLEGVLANAATKLGIFLLDSREVTLQHPLLRHDIAAVDPKHAGMRLGREDFALAGANVERFKEKGIPVILAQVDDLTTDSLAGLNMLWADTTLAYAKLLNIDPGSNPEVKFVRDRAAEALVAAAQGTYDLLSKLYI